MKLGSKLQVLSMDIPAGWREASACYYRDTSHITRHLALTGVVLVVADSAVAILECALRGEGQSEERDGQCREGNPEKDADCH